MLTVGIFHLSSMVNTVCINTREDHQESLKSSSPTDQLVLYIFLKAVVYDS